MPRQTPPPSVAAISGREQGPGDPQRLEEQARQASGIAVQAEGRAPIHGLREVAGEDRDEERGEEGTDAPALLRQHDQSSSEHDLHRAGCDHHAVLVDRQDIGDEVGDLRLELPTSPEQVGQAGEHHAGGQEPSREGLHEASMLRLDRLEV